MIEFNTTYLTKPKKTSMDFLLSPLLHVVYVTSEVSVPLKIFLKGKKQADWVKRILAIKLNIDLYNFCIIGYNPLV